MERLHLPRTEKTPELTFDPEKGMLVVAGSSIHENALEFYRPLINRVQAYIKAPAAHTRIRISLDYFNSSSSKCLLDMFKLFNELHGADGTTVEIEWHYAEDDLDMKEAGEDYGVLLDLPVKLVSDPVQ